MRDAGIRWGVDEAHRGREDLPETAEHTWRQGLRRLLLGYAMTDAGEPVGGLVPCPPGGSAFDAGEVDGELLGRFVSYCEAVFALHERLAGERRPAQWGTVLRDAAGGFLSDGSESLRGRRGSGDASPARELAAEVGGARALVREFQREAAHAESGVPFEVVLQVLRERAGEAGGGTVRLADGVTVASLGPGRIFPAEVVCVVGMNDGAFPRSPPTPSFDLVAAGPARRGDRDMRHEDRFAFLEALLAAQRCFIVTHAGRGLRDDAPIPPSVLVDELKDYLGRRFPEDAVETLHPLQPFSPRYFVASAPEVPGGSVDGALHTPAGKPGERECLFSYSRGMCDAAKTMLAGRDGDGSPARLAGAELPAPDDSRRCVDLADLIAFFANPVRFLLRERLGVRLELDDLTLDGDEPFELDGLERHRLRADVWDLIRTGVERHRAAARLLGSGRLPQGTLGRIVHERAREEVAPLEGRLAPYRAAIDADPREIDLELGGFRVVGTVAHVERVERVEPHGGASGAEVPAVAGAGGGGADRLAWWRIGGLRARDRIAVWLRQLALTAAGRGSVEAHVIWLEEGSWKSAVFSPPDHDAREQIGNWVRAWWKGLVAPLPFFPEASFQYARRLVRSGEDGDGALEAARAKAHEVWFGGRYRRGERLDPYFSLVHDGGDPLGSGFEELAAELLVPLAAAQR